MGSHVHKSVSAAQHRSFAQYVVHSRMRTDQVEKVQWCHFLLYNDLFESRVRHGFGACACVRAYCSA
jgi:hypothetical protein